MVRIVKFCVVTLIFFLSSMAWSKGNVTICDGKQSSHPIDVQLIHLKDSLQRAGIDTIIIYRHWLYANGFNGYGRTVYLDKGKCYQYRVECLKNEGEKELGEIVHTEQPLHSLFDFWISNHTDTATQPTHRGYKMSHDSQHFIEVNFVGKSICYLISGTLIWSNPNRLRVAFVKLLAQKPASNIRLFK